MWRNFIYIFFFILFTEKFQPKDNFCTALFQTPTFLLATSFLSAGSDPLGAAASEEISQPQIFRAKGSPTSSGSTTPTHTTRLRVSGSAAELIMDGRSSPSAESDLQSEEAEKMSSILPTMWMGSQSGRYSILKTLPCNLLFK